MVTAWSLRRIVRTRSGAGPLLRVLATAVLLFGVFVTHGVYVESAMGHLATSATAVSPASDGDGRHEGVEPAMLSAVDADDADDHQGSHGPSLPGEHCVGGQPQQTSALVSPCFAASVRESTGSCEASAVRGPAAGDPLDVESPVALRAVSVVRQV